MSSGKCHQRGMGESFVSLGGRGESLVSLLRTEYECIYYTCEIIARKMSLYFTYLYWENEYETKKNPFGSVIWKMTKKRCHSVQKYFICGLIKAVCVLFNYCSLTRFGVLFVSFFAGVKEISTKVQNFLLLQIISKWQL